MKGLRESIHSPAATAAAAASYEEGRRGEEKGRAAPGPRTGRVRVWDTTGIVNQETRQREG